MNMFTRVKINLDVWVVAQVRLCCLSDCGSGPEVAIKHTYPSSEVKGVVHAAEVEAAPEDCLVCVRSDEQPVRIRHQLNENS